MTPSSASCCSVEASSAVGLFDLDVLITRNPGERDVVVAGDREGHHPVIRADVNEDQRVGAAAGLGVAGVQLVEDFLGRSSPCWSLRESRPMRSRFISPPVDPRFVGAQARDTLMPPSGRAPHTNPMPSRPPPRLRRRGAATQQPRRHPACAGACGGGFFDIGSVCGIS